MNDPSLLMIAIGILLVVGLIMGIAGFFLVQFLFPDLTDMQERLLKYKVRHKASLASQYIKEIDVDRLFKGSDFSNKIFEKALVNLGYVKNLQLKLNRANMKVPVDKFILNFQLLPTICIIPLAAVMPQALFFIPIPFALSYFVVTFKANKRTDRLLLQLPSGLNLMTTALRAGHSFQSAISLVVTEMTDPISTELAGLVTDSNMGIPMKTSLGKLVEHLDLTDIRMFAVSVVVQREAGGNLAEVLDKLGNTIRARQQLKGQVSALTAQSRLTGYLIGAMPFICMLVISIISPEYIAPLFEELWGQIALGVCFLMMCLGAYIIKKIVTIEL